MKLMNALMPGEHNYQQGMPMPGQTGAPMASPQKKRSPVMNALSSVFEFGAPEAFQAGRDRRTQSELGNMLAAGDVAGAGKYAYQRGQLELGDAYTGQASEMGAAKRKQEAQGVLTLFSQGPQFVNQYAMEDPAGFESQTGMTAEEYLQAAGRFGDGGQQFAQFALQKAQAELGQAPSAPEYGAPVEALGPDGKPAYVQWSKTGQAKPMEGYTPPSAAPGYEQITLADGEYEYIPGQPESLRKLGASPVKAPLVSIDNGKGEDAFQGAVGKTAGERYYAVIDAGQKAATTEGNLQAMETLLNEIDYTGFGGTTLLNVQRAGAMVGLEIGDDVAPKEAAQRLSNELALGLKENLPGPMSNADREFLLSIPPNLNVTDAGNDALIFLLRQRTRFEQEAAKSLLEANPQSLQEYQAWERQFQMDYGPIFTPEDKAQLLKDMTGVR